jgi:predicted AlkP superfamily phosphohydrolase/phosphomutase
VEVRDWVVAREVTGGIDWKQTPGLALRSDLFSFIRLNLAGRERLGVLESGNDAHRRYLQHVTDGFLGLCTVGTNARIVKDVVPLQDVFPGSRRHLLPDVLVRWTDEYPVSEVRSAALGLIRGAPDSGRTGEHRPNGFALVLGRKIREQGLPSLTHNSDFPRFVSHLLGAHIER